MRCFGAIWEFLYIGTRGTWSMGIKGPSLLLMSAILAFSCESPSDELMNKIYSYTEVKETICAQKRKNCVEFEDQLYFIEENFIFRLHKESFVKEHVRGHDVKELVAYKGSVVALQKQRKNLCLGNKKMDQHWKRCRND